MSKIVKKIESEPIKYYSISRLKTYDTCSEKYRLQYIEKLTAFKNSESTLIGSLCHNALEQWYLQDKKGTLVSCLEDIALKTFQETGALFKIEPIDSLKQYGPKRLVEELLQLSKDYLSLYIRASADYIGKASIRKKDGGIASNPKMTSGWKDAEKELGLVNTKLKLDYQAHQLNKELGDISLSLVIAEAYFICYSYKVPDIEVGVYAVEMPISQYNHETGELINPVPVPEKYAGKNELYINGYIDKIPYVMWKGEKVLAIDDYKSSASDMTEEDVEWNQQLYNYIYAVEYLTGEEIKLMIIENLRSGNVSIVEVDRQKMEDVLRNTYATHHFIQAGLFKKHIPDSQYAPCLKMYGNPCPFLENCYPQRYEQIAA